MKNFQKILAKILIIVSIVLVILFLVLQYGGGVGSVPEEPHVAIATLVPERAETEATEPTSTPTRTTEPAVEPTEAPTPEPTPTPVPLVENPYKEYFLANEDMAGWLQIPDTNIDYPIMWTPENEDFYLRKGFDGEYDTDSKVEPATTNLIIHGHNMKAGTMFGKLEKYKDAEYGASHSTIHLYTPETLRTYEVVAVFCSQVYKKSDTVFKFYKFFEADSEEEFLDFYNNIKELSLYDTGVTAEYGDRFITLSTCSYHVDNGRFVVVAKEVEEQHLYQPLDESEQ